VRREVRVSGGHVQPPPSDKGKLRGGNGCDAGGHLPWGGGPAVGQPHVEVNDEPCGGGAAGRGGGGGGGGGGGAPPTVPPPLLMVGWKVGGDAGWRVARPQNRREAKGGKEALGWERAG